jgi:hypothetical protein
MPPDRYKWQSHAGLISRVSAVLMAFLCNWLRAGVSDGQPVTVTVNGSIHISARSERSRGGYREDSCILGSDDVVDRYQRFGGTCRLHPQGRRFRRAWKEVGEM